MVFLWSFSVLCTILNDDMMWTFLFGWLMPLCCSGNVHFSNFLWQNVVNLHRPFLHLSFFLAALLLLYFPHLTYSVVGAIFCLWIVHFEMHEMWISCGSHNKFLTRHGGVVTLLRPHLQSQLFTLIKYCLNMHNTLKFTHNY